MMRYVIFAIFCSLIFCQARGQIMYDSIYSNAIKTVQLNRSGSELQPPVLTLEGNERMTLAFDELAPESHSFRYRITHCDAEWRPDGLEPYQYIDGFEEGTIYDFESSFTTIFPYMHYSQRLPADYTKFIISGNYLLTVMLDDNPDSIIFTKRFWVVEQAIDAAVTVSRSPEGMKRNQEVDVTLEWNKDRSPKSGVILQPQYLKVFMQQNGRIDNYRQLPFSNYSAGALCYQWKDQNVYAGGNCFRFFDMSNLRATMYNVQRVEHYGGEIFAMLRPEEDRSQKNYSPTEALNGGMKINARDRNNPTLEADYVWVNFSLPREQPLVSGNIYIVGDLTNWQLDENSQMEWNEEFKAYIKRLELKQGYYSYQLIYRPFGEKEGLTSTLEGDHSATTNTYTAYTYYRGPNDIYDRLISFSRTTAMGN